MLLEAIPKEKIEDLVYNRLLANIRNNIWKNGDKLPSENELCSQLGVSRISVRSAIQRLRALGLVETRHGLGTFVAEAETCNFSGFNKILDLSEKDFNEISELREAIESASLQLIKSKISTIDLNEIKLRYFAMKDALLQRDAVAYTQNDFLFHMAIIHASGNELFVQISNIYKVQLYNYFQEMNKFIFENSNISEDLLAWCESEYDGHSLIYNYLFNDSDDNPSLLMHVFTSGNKKRFESYLASLGSTDADDGSIAAYVSDYFVGSYSYPVKWGDGSIYTGNGKGITHVKFNERTGILSLCKTTNGVRNPSHLAIRHDHLYCVNELDEYEGNIGGAVSVYKIEHDCTLSFLEQMYTHGESPCNASLSPDGNLICISNFNGGSLYSIPLNQNGLFANSGTLFQHTGTGFDPVRQEKPHVHSTKFISSGKYALTVDLGLDRIDIHPVIGDRIIEECSSISVPSGSGPRLICYNSLANVFYVLCELSNEILVYDVAQDIPQNLIQKISTLPDNCNIDNRAGDLVLSSDYRWLYVTNRGHNSIATYEIADDGSMKLAGIVSCHGDEPRSICISDSGKWLLCCNQNSDKIAVFSITSGRPEYTSSLETGTPSCIVRASV